MSIYFAPGRNDSPLGNPEVRDFPLGVSQTIPVGVPMVLTLVSSKTYLRELTSTDISNHLSVSSLVVGIAGISAYTGVTDSNGNASGTLTPSTVAFGAFAILGLPNYAASLDATPDGRCRMGVYIAKGGVEINGRFQGTSNGAQTVTMNTLSTPVGIQISDTTGFAWNSASTSTDIMGEVTYILEQDPNYNVSSKQCVVGVTPLGTYCQLTNGQVYTS